MPRQQTQQLTRHCIFNLLLWIVVLVFNLGCTDPDPSHVIRFGLASTPSNLDPRYSTDATSARINRLIYDRLVDFDEASQPIPSIADWEKISPTHYRFHLRETRLPFHDGTQLTAQDVKATYESILDPQERSPHRHSLSLILTVKAPTDTMVDFILKRPDPLFPSYLVIGILPANLIRKHHPFHAHPVGSGPFGYVTRPDETRLQLVRQHDAQMFEFVRAPDPTVRTLKLLAGEIHMLQNDIPPELIGYLAKDERIRIQRRRGANFAYLGFNLEDSILGKEQVRQAIAYAIDRKSIVKFALGGSASLANALFPPEHWAGDPSLEGYNYDPERARKLLKHAGFDQSHPVSISYKTSSDPFRLRLATILQHQLKKVGVHTAIQSHDWGTFYGDIKAGRFQMYSLAWVGVKTPDIFHYAFHSQSIPPNGANRGRLVDRMTDTMIEKAEASQDIETKQDAYRHLQAYLLKILPYVPLWYEDHVFIARKEVEGYTIAADGNYDGLLHVTLLRTRMMHAMKHD